MPILRSSFFIHPCPVPSGVGPCWPRSFAQRANASRSQGGASSIGGWGSVRPSSQVDIHPVLTLLHGASVLDFERPLVRLDGPGPVARQIAEIPSSRLIRVTVAVPRRGLGIQPWVSYPRRAAPRNRYPRSGVAARALGLVRSVTPGQGYGATGDRRLPWVGNPRLHA